MTKMRFGQFFERITGRSIQQADSLLDIEETVEKKRKSPLGLSRSSSGLVWARGNIFDHSKGKVATLERDLDKYIKA